MSLYNPSGLFDLSVEIMVLARDDRAAAAVKLATMCETMRALIANERRQADAAAAAGQHRIAVGHETVVAMVLRSFPCLPEGPIELQSSYLRLARYFAALDQPRVAGWATSLAAGRTFRFASEPSCQLVVLPALYDAVMPEGPGWFVEVGAYDGVTFSNTSTLAGGGWRGLYIEPNRYWLDMCRKHHSRNDQIRFENCAIGRTAGEGVLHDDGPLSTVSTDRPPAGGDAAPVSIVRLETLLEKHGVPAGFELLVVDVEGHEESVFDSFDLAAWRPRLIIVELGGLDPATPQPDDQRWRVHRHLSAHGYQLVYQDYINAAYLVGSVAI